MDAQPAAFLSYVRFDDQHDAGQLTHFRELLSTEVRAQTGQDFPIFQDRNDIAWGQNWRARIDEALAGVTLLIAVITPSFFRSSACRAEVVRFLEREQALGRDDLILPIYYVSTPELDDPVRREVDDLAQVLAARQYADWRELRFEPSTSPVVRRALAQLAVRIRDSLWQQPPAHSKARTSSKASRARQSLNALALPPSLMRTKQPAAFLGFAPFREQHEDSKLTKLAENLAGEIQLQTGQEFPIFQHPDDIAWDQNWKSRIDDALDGVTLLIAVITPAFFHNSACRAEVVRFLEREQALGRDDLILPIYYISTPELDDPDRREVDDLAQLLAARQYIDWRDLRFEPLASPLVRKALSELANRIQDILSRKSPSTASIQADSSTKSALSKPILPAAHNKVFVSYSHKDRKLLIRLQTHLKPLERDGQLELWDDTRINVGDKWRDEIKEAIGSCRVAILLISADFMASDFIQANELPPLLNDGQRRGVRIFSIIAGYSNFEDTDLAQFEAVNNPSRPLWVLSSAEREAVFLQVYRIVKAALS